MNVSYPKIQQNLEIIDKDTSLIIVLPNQINHQSRVINPQFSSRDLRPKK